MPSSPAHTTNAKKVSNVPLLLTSFSASCTTGGAIYAFGIYGDAMKKNLELRQQDLDTISAMIFVAGLFSWLPGMVVDRYGTRVSLLLGGTSGAAWALLYWALCRQWIFIPQANWVVPILSANGVALCLSCALIVGSMFKITVVCSGPGQRGTAVGVAKGFVGLGAGIYASLFQALRAPNESALDFLPIMATCFIICVVLPAFFLVPTQIIREELVFDMTPLHFHTMYASLFAIMVVIVSTSLGELLRSGNAMVEEDQSPRRYGRALLLLTIWLGPIWSLLLLPRREQAPLDSAAAPPTETTPLATLESTSRPTSSDSLENLEEYESSNTRALISRQSTRQHVLVPDDPNLNLAQMIQTPSCWLMLWTAAYLVGSGTYKTNNMGEMVEALGFPQPIVPATIALFSVAQAVARVVTGVVSETTLQWHGACCMTDGIPRPFYLVIASLIAFVSHLMLAYATEQWVFVFSCTLSGLAFGMAWPLMVLIVGEVFGLEHHGANYMFFDGGTKALGTIFLSDVLVGSVYESHIVGSSSHICVGVECFRTTHLIVAGLALTCVVASFALQYTSRHAYGLQLVKS